MKETGVLAVVSGFSGAGKGTLMKALLDKYDNYALSISATTRSPRPGESNGREYFFVTKERFEDIIRSQPANRVCPLCGQLLRDTEGVRDAADGSGKD